MKRIYTMCAFIAEEDDTQGLAAIFDQNTKTWLPLIAADEKRVEALRPLAAQLAKASGRTIRLFRFQVREMLEEISP